jgi:hypothetical protein
VLDMLLERIGSYCFQQLPGRRAGVVVSSVTWTRKTGQVAKRESPFGTAGWPKVRHGE